MKNKKKTAGIVIGIVAAVILIIVLISSNKQPTTSIDLDIDSNISDNLELDSANSIADGDVSDIEWEHEIAFGSDPGAISYRIVGEDYETYEGSKIRMGVVKEDQNSAKWLIEMTSDVPFLDEYNCIYNFMDLYGDYQFGGIGTLQKALSDKELNLSERIGYIGNGCFYLYGARNNETKKIASRKIDEALDTVVFWNVETNKSIVMNNITIQDIDNYVSGNDVVITELTDYDFRLSNDYFGNIDIKLLNLKTLETKKILSQILNYKNDTKGVNDTRQIGDGLFYSNGAFYNTNGSKAFDLNDKLKHFTELYNFDEGECGIVNQISTGSKYLVVLDKTGKVVRDEKIQ